MSLRNGIVSQTVRGSLRRFALLIYVIGFCFAAAAWGAVGGSVSGTVTDPSGNVVPHAKVTIKEINTGAVSVVESQSNGFFTFPVLPVGAYVLTVQAPGFRGYERKGIALDTGAALTLDAPLQVGSDTQTVSVSDSTQHVETVSTQLGEVIGGQQLSTVPLNGRSFTDLLSLQPGVAPQTSIVVETVQDVGATVFAPSGTLNPGTIAVNGQREFANYFSVNGADAEEDVNAGTAIIPNLDAIAEFRIVTSNFDAEYGEFSGGQISVVTKSGTNEFHGDGFDYLRNTDGDARSYFSPLRGIFQQNIFGGTLGGPVRKNKVFAFIDYQGTRQKEGIDTGEIAVPSAADRAGDLSDFVDSNGNTLLTGAVSGPYIAGILANDLSYPVAQGEPYYYTANQINPDTNAPYGSDCTSSALCVFPNAFVPQSAWSVPAQRMLQYIPAPNGPNGFATSAYNQVVRDDKGAARFDISSRVGTVTAYYFIDDFNLDNPYPVAQSGASVPGFDALTDGRSQLVSLGDIKVFNASTVNEFHLSFLRDSVNLGQPLGGRGVSLTSQGFENSEGSASIVALDPKGQSVENLNFNSYSTGAAANQLIQDNNTYQAADNVTEVVGRHSMKFGVEFHTDQVNVHPIAQFNGSFVFSGTETGVDFADFLVGAPSQYNQSQLNPFFARNKYVGLFAQDSWHALSSLTLSYGLRWDRIASWSEKYNQISTFEAGKQSVVFPTAPAGILYPGDPGVPNTLAPIGNLGFSPRVGFAWTPQASGKTALAKLLGAGGATSIRGSAGNFYTAIEALSISVLAANAPYGTTYTSPVPPIFAQPFVAAATGQFNGQPFPYTFAPFGASASKPNTTFDWSNFEPISGIPVYSTNNKVPYTEEWMFSLERQLGANTLFSATYIGTATHRQRVLEESNPGDPALCLSLSQPSEVQPGTLTCGPGGENGVYYPIGGGVVNGTRGPLGPNFGSNATQTTIGRAHYDALQLSARYSTPRLLISAAYTYSKSLDQSSNIGEEVNPFNPNLSYAISAFDVRHNIVLNYQYQLPFQHIVHWRALGQGWSLSGVTRLSSGFPVNMINNEDNSLIGTNPNGVNNASIDEPDYSGGALHLVSHPSKHGNQYFDTTAFSLNALGTAGNAKRRFFYGPGEANFDTAVSKTLPIAESRSLLFRVEAFNVFNHTRFFGPDEVDGDIGSSTFGQVVDAEAARVMQAALKFNF